MAFTAADSTLVIPGMSFGNLRIQFMDVSAVSGDTTGTITSSNVSALWHVIMPPGFTLTAAPTFAGRVCTLAFTVPATGAFGTVMCIGRS